MATTIRKKSPSRKTSPRKPAARKAEVRRDVAKTYNEFKTFEGQQYTGMKIGRSHKWYYDQGEWKEEKVTPEEWEFNYGVTNAAQAGLRKVLVFRSEPSINGIYMHIRTYGS